MHQFFKKSSEMNETPLAITGDDYNHIKNVLRLRCGEEILVSDGAGKEYICRIEDYLEEKGMALLKITDVFASAQELPTRITLFQGYPKGDKMDTIVQKAVELGVFEIVPVIMNRSVVKLDEKKAQKKVERLNGIALSAAKQSKRGIVPQVKPVMKMREAVAYAAEKDYIILPYENAEGIEHARCVLKEVKGKKEIGVFIGPEGGFEPFEVEMIKEIGGNSITLGKRILRTETAGIAMMSILMFLLEE